MVRHTASPSIRPRSSSTMVPPTQNAVLAWCTAVACTSGVVTSGLIDVPRSRHCCTSATIASMVVATDGWSGWIAKAATSPWLISVPCFQITPLGMPVVPPVYQSSWSSPERSMRGAGACAASTSS